jgi:hypothetical protein
MRKGRHDKSESLIDGAGQVRGDGLLSQGREDGVIHPPAPAAIGLKRGSIPADSRDLGRDGQNEQRE